MSTHFLQLHTLTHYSASLLNRDDAGFAKRMPFGGAVRTRISSQCLKRHWRVYNGEHSLHAIDAPESVRSRISFERYVVDPLITDGVPEELANLAAQRIVATVVGSADADATATKQVTVFGRPELKYLCQLAKEVISATDGTANEVKAALDTRLKERDLKENLKALHLGAGLSAALFGRMVTGDILSRTDAAIHVAHAMTVHGQMTESDYFSALDDLVADAGELGAGHINVAELTSGLFYGYVVVDIAGLLDNIGGDLDLAGRIVECLAHIVATVSPGAKKGSTAPYAYSHLVLCEAGNAQPRTLQNAFIDPVATTGNLVDNAYQAMEQHLADLDAMYGKHEQRSHAGLATNDRFERLMPLVDLAAWMKAQVRN